jgi:hypothetical protein
MAFGHGNQKPARGGRGRGRGRRRGGRDGNVSVEAEEPSAADTDAQVSTILRNLAPHASPKPTRQGVLNLIGKYMAARARSFDEAVQSLRFQTRTPTGAGQVIDFAKQQGVELNASDKPSSDRTGGSETGMAGTKKQAEQRAERERRQAQSAAAKGGSKGQGGAQAGAGQAAGAKGGAQAAGGAKKGAGATPRRRTPRQPELPDPDGGFAQESIAEIDAATEAYVQYRDEHAEATKRLSEAKAHLMDRMKHHKKERYKWEGQIVVYTHEEAENVKVEKAKKSAADEPNAV